MGQIVVVQVGQAGIQVGQAFLTAVAAEHGVDMQGNRTLPQSDGAGLDVLFRQIGDQRFCARSVMVDLDPQAQALCTCSPASQLFDSERIVIGEKSTGGNFAAGYYIQGPEILEQALRVVTWEANACEDLDGFLLIHSAGGGTGSGLGCLLLQALKERYPEAKLVAATVLPSIGYELPGNPIAPYNATACLAQLSTLADLVLMLDNEVLIHRAHRAGLSDPPFAVLNADAANLLRAATLPLRVAASDGDASVSEAPRPYIDPITKRWVHPTQAVVQQQVHTLSWLIGCLTNGRRFGLEVPTACRFITIVAGKKDGRVFSADDLLRELQWSSELPESGSLIVASLFVLRSAFEQRDVSSMHGPGPASRLQLDRATTLLMPKPAIGQEAVILMNASDMTSSLVRLCENFSMLFQRFAYLDWMAQENMEAEELAGYQAQLQSVVDAYMTLKVGSEGGNAPPEASEGE